MLWNPAENNKHFKGWPACICDIVWLVNRSTEVRCLICWMLKYHIKWALLIVNLLRSLGRTFSMHRRKLSPKIEIKGVPREAEVAQGVPVRLRSRIISTFGTTRVVVRQPYAPATFTPGEIPGTHFQRLSRPQSTWFCRKEPRKKS